MALTLQDLARQSPSAIIRGLRYGKVSKRLPTLTGRDEALEWFRSKIQGLLNPARATPEMLAAQYPRNPQNEQPVNPFGHMYVYNYDAATKEKLPYWDRFPLVLYIEPAAGGHYGLNFHYLDPQRRVALLKVLAENFLRTNDDGSKYMELSYQTLKYAAGARAFRPAFKHYLSGQMGAATWIKPDDWVKTILLPTERFAPGGRSRTASVTKAKVWADSRRKI